MIPKTHSLEWFELTGVIAQQNGTPHFLDLVFKAVLPKWKDDDGRRYVQVIDSKDAVESMAEIEPYTHHILSFAEVDSPRKSIRVGGIALYAIQFYDLIDVHELDIISGFYEACKSAFLEGNINQTLANPFFGLALAQAIDSMELEIRFSSLSFRILKTTNPVLADSWLENRKLSNEARQNIMSSPEYLECASDKLHNGNEVIHLKVVILNTIRNASVTSRYFVEDGLLISFHVGDVGFLFKNRTATYDAIVAPYANFQNGEDFHDICKIATVPFLPTTMLKRTSGDYFDGILVSDSPDLAESIKDIVKASCLFK